MMKFCFSLISDGKEQKNWANYNDQPAEVTPNGGLVGESLQNDLNSGLGIILICPESNLGCVCRMLEGQQWKVWKAFCQLGWDSRSPKYGVSTRK